jgi:hypothetical protein
MYHVHEKYNFEGTRSLGMSLYRRVSGSQNLEGAVIYGKQVTTQSVMGLYTPEVVNVE